MENPIKFVSFIIVLTTLIACGANLLNKKACTESAMLMDIEYKYSFLTGCFVKYKGDWIGYGKIYRL